MACNGEGEDTADGGQWWTVRRGESPVLATAIHNGHAVPSHQAELMSVGADHRLREEDPFTEFVIRDVPNSIVVHRSRFAVDLNRARDAAVYLSPDQCWGMEVWAEPPTPAIVAESRQFHDQYYRMLHSMLQGLEDRYGAFAVLDVHSYNHRRDGADARPTPAEAAPQINIGTFSMDRQRWAHVVDPFMEALRGLRFQGRSLDVRENVAFQGRGEQTRFIHREFPETGCAIAIEFKKTFMDEWTGQPDRAALDELRATIRASLPVLEDAILKRPG